MNKSGYAGKILDVDVSSGRTVTLPTDAYADRFIGGRGLAAKLYWDKVSPQTKALDPENCLMFVNGPLTGFTRLATSRWQVCGKSPAMEPQWFSYCNVGGSWGNFLKFAGYDGMVVSGKSDKLVYLFVHDGKVEIKDAAHLRGKRADEAREMLKIELGKEVRVVSTGAAGENMVEFAGVLADEDSHGASGFGAVMGSKKLKAIAVIGDKRPTAAQPEKLAKLADRLRELRGERVRRHSRWDYEGKTKRQACYGCGIGCGRNYYRLDDGRNVKFYCHFADYYEGSVVGQYGKWTETVVHAADLCHHYTLDSFVLEPMIIWLGRCFQAGVLTEKETGLPLSKIGTPEFIETLLKKISLREGFGDILAHGTRKAAELVGKGSAELIGDIIVTRANDYDMYDPRMYLVAGVLYATEPRKPIQQLHEVTALAHQWIAQVTGPARFKLTKDSTYVGKTKVEEPELLTAEDMAVIGEKFWGSRVAADFSTYEGKALAAKKIQDREYAKESLILCDSIWPIIWIKGGKSPIGEDTLESQIYSSVTGIETDKDGLDKLGERVFNLQRAIRLREGWLEKQGDNLLDVSYKTPIETARFNVDCLVPDKDGKPVSRKGKVVERDKFDKMMNEYYELRGWDTKGLPTKAKFKDLELDDIAKDLEKKGLLSKI